MAKLRLIIEIDAMRPKAAMALAELISDRADSDFEDATSLPNAKPMSLRSWIIKPGRDGKFG